jgi:hypothetical protein
MCDDAISLVFLSPSVHFGVHWVVECAGENQAIGHRYTLYTPVTKPKLCFDKQLMRNAAHSGQ